MTETNPNAKAGGDDNAMRLSIDVREPSPNLFSFKLAGRLDVFTYRELAKQMDAHCDGNLGVRMVLDLAGVVFVASSGWSVFVAQRNKLVRIGGRMAISGMNKDLHRIYSTMKLPTLVPAFESAAEAEASLIG